MPNKAKTAIFANRNTLVFHRADKNNDRCRKSAIKKSNIVNFGSPAEAIRDGYRGCEHCFPVEGDGGEA